MAGGDTFLLEVSKRVMLASLEDADAIRYRQEILADCLAHRDVIHEMYAVGVAALEDKRGFWGRSSQFPTSILSGAITQLEAATVRLRQLRRIADDHAEEFSSVGASMLFSSLRHELGDDYFATINQHLKQLRFRDGVLISARLARDNSGVGFVLRSRGEARARWKERLGIERRSSYSFSIAPRDEAGAQTLSDLSSRGINLVANAAAQSADHLLGVFAMLRSELGFYVSCIQLFDQLTKKDATVSFPDPFPVHTSVLSATELGDACLVLQSDEAVVGNDVDANEKPLVVVTGANSGGKSTFLRSVGVAQLMMQCGMFVTAATYQASVAKGLFTHFIREEDPSMTRGRLDDELSRMSAIADQIRPGGVIFCNESFASTNEREGSEIARQVVRAMLGAEVRVIFVTHLFDFAESAQREYRGAALFLRAPRREDGWRSYRLEVAEPLPTSFGADLYYRLGGWLGELDLRIALDAARSAETASTAGAALQRRETWSTCAQPT